MLQLSYIKKSIKANRFEFTEHPIDCGHDTVSARAAGCVYDIMMVGWTAPNCVDPYVLSDSLSNTSELAGIKGAGHFTFSVTQDFTEIVQQDVDSITQHDWLYANWEFHKAHCAYVWRVLANSLERKRKGETDVYVYRTLIAKREVGEVSTDYIFTDDPAAGGKVGQKMKKRESGEVSTDYIFTDDPAAGGKVGQKKKRESGEVSTDYIFTDDPAAGGKVGQKKKRESGEVSTDYIFTDDPAAGGKVGQ
ncbi:hypothetical protein QIS74_06962 [Colletotrichum tabaci]|uniref:Uncharacterized protein n=1 Tax=Colletotrichum tabaci TaxID=1209068 RepID=A0AAV9T9Z0_9PEZI